MAQRMVLAELVMAPPRQICCRAGQKTADRSTGCRSSPGRSSIGCRKWCRPRQILVAPPSPGAFGHSIRAPGRFRVRVRVAAAPMAWLEERLCFWMAPSRSFSKAAAFRHLDRPRLQPEDDRQTLQTLDAGAGGAMPCSRIPIANEHATLRYQDRAVARSRLSVRLRLLCGPSHYRARSVVAADKVEGAVVIR